MPRDNWEIWLNTQISPIIAKWMSEFIEFTVKSSYSLQLNALTDTAIYYKAKSAGNMIVIKKGNCDNRELCEFIRPNISRALNIFISSNVDIVELE